MLSLVFAAAQADMAIVGGANVCLDASVCFYFANEGLSYQMTSDVSLPVIVSININRSLLQ
jgi:phage-related holin